MRPLVMLGMIQQFLTEESRGLLTKNSYRDTNRILDGERLLMTEKCKIVKLFSSKRNKSEREEGGNEII